MSNTILNTSDRIKNFLEKTLKENLQQEIDGYIRRYVHPDGKADEVITYNEVAILSLVKSALVRREKPDEVWAMQEYQVYDSINKYGGRADLYVFFRKPPFDCELLIEAKRDGKFHPNLRYDQNVWKSEVKKVMEQCRRYFEMEESYFSSPTYLITMFLETLEIEEKEDYQIHKLELKQDVIDSAEYTFYIQPQGSSKLLCVYGQIQKAKD